jgi:ABC-type oligopeptide transport system substrate-binding subunit
VTFDNRELDKLQLDLSLLAKEGDDAVTKPVEDIAKAIQKDWQANARAASPKHAKHFPRSITIETKSQGTHAEIGPERAKTQGFLGAILEYGAVYSPPFNLMKDAVDRSEKRFSKLISDSVHKEIKRRIA